MLAIQHLGVAVAEFSCSNTSCIPTTPQAKQAIEALQLALNRFANAGLLRDFRGQTLSPLPINGQIDKAVVNAVAAAGSAMKAITPVSEGSSFDRANFEALALGAEGFTVDLNRFVIPSSTSKRLMIASTVGLGALAVFFGVRALARR